MAFLAPLAASAGAAGAGTAGTLGAGAGAAGAGAAGAGAAGAGLGGATTALNAGAGSAGSMFGMPAASSTLPSTLSMGNISATPSFMSKLGGGAKNLVSGQNSLFNGLAQSFLEPKPSAPPPEMPARPQMQGQPFSPVQAPPSVGNAGPLKGLPSSSGMSPQLMKLIEMLSQGKGGIS